MSGTSKKQRKFGKKAALICAVLAVLLTSVFALALTKPPIEEVKGHISRELIEEAQRINKYNETTFDFFILNIARGRNVNIKSQDVETYIGIAGGVVQANEGVPKALADMVFWLPTLLSGTWITVSLTILSVLAGLFLSIFLALGKIITIPTDRGSLLRWLKWLLFSVIKKFCNAYIFFFRGTPLLMQLFFIYFGLPLIFPSLILNDKYIAAFIAFTLNSAAYCAEIIRAAIQSIDKGQMEASKVLGLSYGKAMRLVIIPQSFRRLIPPVANEFIMVIKDVSLVSIISLTDLSHQTRAISNSSGSPLVFVPAMIIYLIITAFFTFIFNRLERRFSVYV